MLIGRPRSTVSGPSSAVSFGYNGLGDRLQQVAGGVTIRYALDLNNDLAQVLSDGSNTYLYGLNRIAQQNIFGRQYCLGDALGSVRQLVNPVGAVTLARSYEPFGKLLSTAGNPLTKYGYTDEWTDPTSLVYLRARYYDPATGRFLTRDLFPGLLHAPHTQHPYGYAANNPATYTDPSGLFAPWDVLDIGSFLWSLHDFVECPSWGNAGWLALDVIGLLPVIPSIGLIGKLFGKSDDAITLFRVVSSGELIDIFRFRGFRPHPGGRSMAGKWFWETMNSARKFGIWTGEPFNIIEVKISKSVADQVKRYKNLDQIGNARYFPEDMLDLLNRAIISIKQVK